jgi:2-oxoglutarate dehydrogenase E1 component
MMSATRTISTAPAAKAERRGETFDLFRRWGYLEARLDPLGHMQMPRHPELEVSGKAAEEARKIYCGSVGAEFMHLPQAERRQWIIDRMEAKPERVDAEAILKRLVRAETFEHVIQARYLGTKRFSLEGLCGLIPYLDETLEAATERGAIEAVLGMSHRGRLNIMLNIVGRDASEIFAGFEDVDPRSVLGAGDVKYHMGATGEYASPAGNIHIHLVSNPSHLEAVDPVVIGRTRAKQIRSNDVEHAKYLPIVIHGDAAFAGQGIWAETLNLSGLHGYNVGGAIHLIANNLIGFTTTPKELHPTQFASELAKRLHVPIFHVNAEDPDALVRVARMAVEYRYEFNSDVVADIIGFRRYGHSEVDDPTITQPILYKIIKDHPPIWETYATAKRLDATSMIEESRHEFEAAQLKARSMVKMPLLRTFPKYWDGFAGGPWKPEYEVETGVAAAELAEVTKALTSYPENFAIHPKIKRLLEERAKMGAGEKPVDYGMAEALALGTALKQGIPIRLSGQDSRRGTFNQRHSVLIDTENEQEYVPLAHVSPSQARCEIYNSTLSEAGVLGFEYGYSRDYPETLVMWEAQFGDFANGAQVVIDQFIAAGEDKWGLLSGVVMLLPHGFEGQGPEHSSARMERYLQLAAEDNVQICQPSTAAQYFHLLRRQALQKWRKPLVVFTPKSMLRHPDAASEIREFAEPHFQRVMGDRQIENAQRVLVCTGKIGHELRRERAARKETAASTAIIFLEQIFPFPKAEMEAEMAKHPNAREIIWVQEEPANMGALHFVQPRLERAAGGRKVRSIKRSASASPATGSAKAHEMEQRTLLTLAFASGISSTV